MSVSALLEVARKELDPAKAKECTTDGCNHIVMRDQNQTDRAWTNKKFCNACLAARVTESRRKHREKNPPKVEKPKFCQNPECNNQLEQITGTTRKYCSPKCADIMKRKKTVEYTRKKRQEVKEFMAKRENKRGGMVRYMVDAETPVNGKELAQAHWEYNKKLLLTYGVTDQDIKKAEFVYISAFEHGYKHAQEER